MPGSRRRPDPAWLPADATSIAAARSELRAASAALLARGLVAPAKWVGEQLQGLPPPDPAHSAPPPPSPPLNPADAADADAIALASALVAGREYRRAAHALERATGPIGAFLGAWALYLAGEASRAAARLERGAAAAAGAGAALSAAPGGGSAAAAPAAAAAAAGSGGALPTAASAVDPGNPELGAVASRLEAAAAARGGAWDPYWLYLLGLVRADRGEDEAAVESLAASVRGAPLNWGAWAALALLAGRARCGAASAAAGPVPEPSDCGEEDGDAFSVTAPAADPRLPDHWVVHFYAAHLAVEAHDAPAALAALAPLGAAFPASEWVGAAAAVAHYFARNFDEAQELFEDAHARDPHRLDDIDTFSNVLYVKDDAPALAALARSAAATDKWSAPAAIAAGNYFSLRGDHARAVASFRRALALAPPPASTAGLGGGPGGGAWTLLGHEFVELQNPAAAVDAYRRAADAAPGDYRAWYGLGQAYELLHLPHHALWYYRRAASLRPGDARMWVAVGQCCEGGALADDGAAAAAYRRALRAGDDGEGSCLGRLARVHERLGDHAAAAAYHTAALAAADARAAAVGGGGGPDSDPAAAAFLSPDAEDALLYLAASAREEGDWSTVEKHARRLADAAAAGGWDGGEAGAGAAAARALLADARRAAAAAAAAGGSGPPLAPPGGRRRSSVGGGGGRRRPSVGGASPAGASPRW